MMIEKGELATSVEKKRKKKKPKSSTWTMLGMTNCFTDCFYLWRFG